MPQNPISAPQKEVELGAVSDYILPSEAEPKIEKEVSDAGVKEVSQTPKLTEEHYNIGVKHAADSTPVQREPTGMVKLPMEQNQASVAAKGNINDSKTWLANLVLRLIRKMRLSGQS
jgi:hypothetical protein